MKPTLLINIRRTLGAGLFAASLAISPLSATAAEASATPAQSASELLEQGVYNQETKGDLDAAITAYQQVVAEAKANDALAAQAEFRLGQCYQQEGRSSDATAAFQKVVHDYPGETGLVAKARQLLPGEPKLNPVPWVDGERLLLKFHLPDGSELGMCEYHADLVTTGTQQVWRVGGRMDAATAGQQSNVDADPVTFHPISSTWKHSMFGEVTATYHPASVDVQRVGKSGVTTLKVDGPVVDNEQSIYLIRRLPLAGGYTRTIKIFSSIGGAAVPLDIEVKGIEKLTVPAGEFDCFKVQLSVGQTFWISTDLHRYIVQFEAGPVTAKLDSIAQGGPNVPVQFTDADLGVSMTAPPDWIICRLKGGQPAGQSLIRTYDPDADAVDGGIRYYATDSLDPAARESSKAWSQSAAATDGKRLGNDFKVRPDSWQDTTVAGLPAESFIADYSQNGKPRTLLSVHVIAPKNSESFVLIAPPDKFDALNAQFQNIIASYHRS